MRQVLVVANQTLGGEDLLATLRERLEAEPAELWIVVPATEAPSPPNIALIGPGASTAGSIVEALPEVEDASAVADRRLRRAVEKLGQLGAPVDGEVGDPDPLQAIGDVLERRRFDEIVISTLPSGISRWLHTDLPSRVQRTFDLPVTTVTARKH